MCVRANTTHTHTHTHTIRIIHIDTRVTTSLKRFQIKMELASRFRTKAPTFLADVSHLMPLKKGRGDGEVFAENTWEAVIPMRVTEPKSYHDCWDLVKANIAREDTVLIYHEPVLLSIML